MEMMMMFPNGTSTLSDSIEIAFSAQLDGVTVTVPGFECSLDDEPFADCADNPISFVDLSVGEHTFEVRAFIVVDGIELFDPTPATLTWNIDEDGDGGGGGGGGALLVEAAELLLVEAAELLVEAAELLVEAAELLVEAAELAVELAVELGGGAAAELVPAVELVELVELPAVEAAELVVQGAGVGGGWRTSR